MSNTPRANATLQPSTTVAVAPRRPAETRDATTRLGVNAGVAQLVERLSCKQGVTGSSPVSGFRGKPRSGAFFYVRIFPKRATTGGCRQKCEHSGADSNACPYP